MIVFQSEKYAKPFLEPLPPGNHTLRTTTSVFNPMSPEYNYASTLTYHLLVKP